MEYFWTFLFLSGTTKIGTKYSFIERGTYYLNGSLVVANAKKNGLFFQNKLFFINELTRVFGWFFRTVQTTHVLRCNM